MRLFEAKLPRVPRYRQVVRDLAEPSAISLNGPIGPRRRWT